MPEDVLSQEVMEAVGAEPLPEPEPSGPQIEQEPRPRPRPLTPEERLVAIETALNSLLGRVGRLEMAQYAAPEPPPPGHALLAEQRYWQATREADMRQQRDRAQATERQRRALMEGMQQGQSDEWRRFLERARVDRTASPAIRSRDGFSEQRQRTREAQGIANALANALGGTLSPEMLHHIANTLGGENGARFRYLAEHEEARRNLTRQLPLGPEEEAQLERDEATTRRLLRDREGSGGADEASDHEAQTES